LIEIHVFHLQILMKAARCVMIQWSAPTTQALSWQSLRRSPCSKQKQGKFQELARIGLIKVENLFNQNRFKILITRATQLLNITSMISPKKATAMTTAVSLQEIHQTSLKTRRSLPPRNLRTEVKALLLGALWMDRQFSKSML